MLKERISEFERIHPTIHVELIHSPENYFQKLHILIASDLTPDVMAVNSLYFPVYASRDIFRDLGPFLESDPTLSPQDFYPQALQTFQWQTQQKALPRDVSNLVMYYNRDLFDQASIAPPSAHWTWQECLEKAQALTQLNPPAGELPRFGLSFYGNPPLFWLPFVWSWGGDVFDDTFSQIRVAEPAATEGLRFYQSLRTYAHVAPRQEESGGTSMSQLFIQQRIAMMVNGRWMVPALREQAHFRWEVAPFPAGPVGSRVGIDSSGYAMAAETKHPKEAWQLIAFLLSRASLEAFTRSGLIIPARPDVANSPTFLEPGKPPQNSHVFLDAIATGVPTHTPPRWNEISESLMLALEPVWAGTKTPEEALAPLQKSLETKLPGGTRP